MAVALPRSVFLTLALHGIVEAGAAWLPLDTGYPDDRLRMMLEGAFAGVAGGGGRPRGARLHNAVQR